MMDLTVAICTYHRLEPLETALSSLAGCVQPLAKWELLVVDNGCQPAVRAMVMRFSDQLPVRYVEEPRLGASHARNRAISEAAAGVVLFTDDDVTFDPHWLSRMWQAICRQPNYAMWGGRVEPSWPAQPPAWFDPRCCAMLADTIVQYRQGSVPRLWDPQRDPPFFTANLALRTEAIRQVGGFDTRVGHRGKLRMGMEDSLLVRAIASAGHAGWYAADAVVHHPVPMERLTRRYARSFAWRQGWLSVQMHRCGPRVPRWFYRQAGEHSVAGLARWLTGALRLRAGQAFAGQFELVYSLSKLWHAGLGRPSRDNRLLVSNCPPAQTRNL